MNDALRLLQHVPPWVRELHVNPWAAVIAAGLVAAWIEQRRVARRAPPFSAEHEGVAAGKSRR